MDLGGRIVMRDASFDRMESEATLRRKNPGARVDYLGLTYEHPMHYWRVGGRKWEPLPATSRVEGKQVKREIKCEYRPEVWLGSGRPVDPVDFSRPPVVEERPFPAPTLTSGMPHEEPTSRPAAALLLLAQECGWTGHITQARGHVPHATTGRPSAEAKFSEALRLARGSERAVAVRLGGSWTSLWTWSASRFFARHATLEAFKVALNSSRDTGGASCAG